MPRVSIAVATPSDAPSLAALHALVADDLTARHGRGPWSFTTSERVVLQTIESARVLVARQRQRVVGTLTLATRKPWAIDPTYFTAVPRPLYLTSMAVLPAYQRRGVGGRLLEAAREAAIAWPADAIRLDAYDAAAGAGPFYARCGYAERGRAVYRGTPHVYFELCLRPEP